MLRITCILFALAITTKVAEAQRAPDMATLDRGDGISKIGLDLAYTALDTHYSGALRFELYGQYVTRSGLGLYGALPFAHSFGDAPEPFPQPDTVLGNLDLGLLYVVESSRTLSWVFRGGVALPTASGAATARRRTCPRSGPGSRISRCTSPTPPTSGSACRR